MSKNIDFSYKIVQSLSQTEKRYFKIYLKAFSVKSNKMVFSLFSIMEKTKPFNEVAIKSAFFKLYPDKNYSIQKKSLQKILEKILSNYHREKNVENKINELLHLSTIYASKQLYDIQKSTLLKAKRLAEKVGTPAYTLKIKILLNQLLSFHNVQQPTKKMFDEFSIVTRELNQTNIQSSNYTLYLTLFNNVFFTARQFANESITELKYQFKKIKNFEMLFLSDNYYFIESDFLKLYTQNIYFFQIADLENSHNIRLKLYDLVKNNPTYRNTHLNNFHITINGLIISYVWMNDMDNAILLTKELKQEIKNIPKDDEGGVLYLKTLYTEKMLLLLISNPNKEDAKVVIEESLRFFNQHKNKLSAFNQALLKFRLSACYFQEKEYKRSLTLIQDISYYEKHPLLSDVIVFSRIMELIAHFELKNEEIILSYALSISRSKGLKKSIAINQLLVLFATFFQNKKKQQLLKILDFYQALPLFKYYNSSFFDLEFWLKDKILS